MKSVCQVKSFKTLRGCFQPSGGEAPPGPTKPPPPMWSPSPDSSRQLESLHLKVDLFTEVLFLQQDESQSRTSAVSKHWSFHDSKQNKQGNHMYSHLSTKTDQAWKSVTFLWFLVVFYSSWLELVWNPQKQTSSCPARCLWYLNPGGVESWWKYWSRAFATSKSKLSGSCRIGWLEVRRPLPPAPILRAPTFATSGRDQNSWRQLTECFLGLGRSLKNFSFSLRTLQQKLSPN